MTAMESHDYQPKTGWRKFAHITNKPAGYTAPVFWYVAPDNQREPITLFSTKADAIEHARQLPPVYWINIFTGERIPQLPSIDWSPVGEPFTTRRPVIDRRKEKTK